MIICCHHAKTSLIATNENGKIVGFVSGYLLPERTDTLFVWEVSAHKEYRSYRIGPNMLQELCRRVRPTFIEATINPTNAPSKRCFKQLAEIYKTKYTTSLLFPASSFKPQVHEDELLYHIGSIPDDILM